MRERLLGVVKYQAELNAVERFLRRLSKVNRLPDPSADFSRFMYTRAALFHIEDPSRLLPVRTLLWDTGAHGGNYMGRRFLEKNREFLLRMINSSDTSVFLADGITELKIDESVTIGIFVTTFSGKTVTINATFFVIVSGCDIILGFNDMVLQAGDALVDMIQRAVAFAKSEARHATIITKPSHPLSPPAAVAIQAPYRKDRFASPLTEAEECLSLTARNPTLWPQSVVTTLPFKPATVPYEGRARESTGAPRAHSYSAASHTKSTVAQASMLSGASDLKQYEDAAQDIRAPWTTIDVVAPEELDAPEPGLFNDASLNFMEVPVLQATAEYLAALAVPPADPVAIVAVPILGADGLPPPAPPRGRFAPELYAHPGFLEYMRTTAIKAFVPQNWEGIRVPPVEFKFKSDMPTHHRAKARPIPQLRLEATHKEIMRLCKYHLVPSNSSFVSPVSIAPKKTEPFVRVTGDYRFTNVFIEINQEWISDNKVMSRGHVVCTWDCRRV